jgi:hypothetical protein
MGRLCWRNGCCGLRQHRFGIMAVASFELAPSLESEHDWIIGRPVFRHRRVELGQPLQTRELVQHQPHSSMTGLTAVHQPQHQHVQPETRERHEARPCFRRARQKQPPTTVVCP